jgi:hypothetical protein
MRGKDYELVYMDNKEWNVGLPALSSVFG